MLVLASLLLLLSSCNDIDGRLSVHKIFSLTDEDGRVITIPVGSHDAEFSFSRRKSEVELEIDDIDQDDDRDFEFHVPNMSEIDFGRDEIEIEVPAADNGQDVDLNTSIAKEVTKLGPYWKYFGNYCWSDRARYPHQIVIYDVVKTEVDVEVEIWKEEDDLASFSGSSCRKQTQEHYCIDCYGRVYYGCIYESIYYC